LNLKSNIFQFYLSLTFSLIGNYSFGNIVNSPDSTNLDFENNLLLDCDPQFMNSGLEGGLFPVGWTNCFGTVDVQPGEIGVTTLAAEGNHFFGFHSNDFDFSERPQGELTTTLVPGSTYYLQFKYAVVPVPGVFPLWGGGGHGDHPGHIDVYASSNFCGVDELIGSTPVITSGDGWVQYELIFEANFAHNYISFNPKSDNDNWVYLGLDDLNIISNPTEINPSICEGQSFNFAGDVYTEEGSYTHIFENSLSCDSMTLINLSLKPNFTSNQNIEICEGESWQQGGDSYTLPGNYNYTHIATNGCDSVVTTNLTVNTIQSETNNVAICDGEEHIEGTSSYTSTGNYSDIYTSVNNCDSIVLTNLTVNQTYYDLTEAQICSGTSFMFNGNSYTESDSVNFILTSNQGCDSIIELHLIVDDAINVSNEIDLCEGQSYTEGSSEYTVSGTYIDTYVNVNGCDSAVTSILEFHESFNSAGSIDICEGQSIEVGNNIYTQTGNYIDILTSIHGCDSIVETNLNVIPKDLIADSEVALCEGENYTVDLSSINSDQILWSDNSTGSINSFNEPGTYFVDILLDSCYVSDTINIFRHHVPALSFDEISGCWGNPVQLSLEEDNGEIEWFNGSTNSIFIAQNEGTYSATINNACGTYQYSANVIFEDCSCSIFIPNSFTPDGDGYNDTFGIHYSCDFIKYDFKIFDRWGHLAFSATNPDIQWTGELETKGYVHNSNAYNYILNYTAINSEGKLINESRKGHITQIR